MQLAISQTPEIVWFDAATPPLETEALRQHVLDGNACVIEGLIPKPDIVEITPPLLTLFDHCTDPQPTDLNLFNRRKGDVRGFRDIPFATSYMDGQSLANSINNSLGTNSLERNAIEVAVTGLKAGLEIFDAHYHPIFTTMLSFQGPSAVGKRHIDDVPLNLLQGNMSFGETRVNLGSQEVVLPDGSILFFSGVRIKHQFSNISEVLPRGAILFGALL